MLDDAMNVFFIVLDVVFPELHNSELILSFQMRCLNQIKDLHPMTILQRILSQILDELNDQIGVFYLLVYLLADTSTLSLDELMLWELIIQIFHDFVNGFDYHLSIKVQERSVVAHLSSFLPVQQNFPESY